MTTDQTPEGTNRGNILEVPPILGLPPPDKNSLHPSAFEAYLEFLIGVYVAVPTIFSLTDHDLKRFLSETECSKLKACQAELNSWLSRGSKDNASTYLFLYSVPYSATSDLKSLLGKVGQAKLLEQQRIDAIAKIAPPYHDAKRSFDEKEYEQFRQSLISAADAYLDWERGSLLSDWRKDSRAAGYLKWTRVIENRKEFQASLLQSGIERSEFSKEINHAISAFRKELADEKKPGFTISTALAKYEPGPWFPMMLPTKKEIEKWANPLVWGRVPQILARFVSWDLKWETAVTPRATYELLSLPCLRWQLRLTVLAEVHLRIEEKAFSREFSGHEYKMAIAAEDLGSLYLGPVRWRCEATFTTPIPLLSLLATGSTKCDGIYVTKAAPPWITFATPGGEEKVTQIHTRFREFIMDITKKNTLAQGLLQAGVIDKLTSYLVEQQTGAHLSPPGALGASAGEDNSAVMAAIEQLGYKVTDIQKGIDEAHLTPGMSLEEKVKKVLQKMSH